MDLVKAKAKPSPRSQPDGAIGHRFTAKDRLMQEDVKDAVLKGSEANRAFAVRLRGEGLPVGWLSSCPRSGEPEQRIKRFVVKFKRSTRKSLAACVSVIVFFSLRFGL